jgi:hypothetical protein
MSVWKKYHYIFYGGLIVLFLVSSILLSIGYDIISLSTLVAGIIIIFIWARKIVCPKCNLPLSAGHNFNSGYYTGYHVFLPKKCLKCGAELDGDEA